MPRQLPTISLEGTAFFIDVAMNEFRQVDDPSNNINFNDIQRRVNESFILTYNTLTKGLFPWEHRAKPYPAYVVEIDVPSPRNLDPIAYDPLQRTYPLPIFWIGETEFEVDVHFMTLSQKGNPHNTIHFAQMDDHGTYYQFRFHKEDKTMAYLKSDDAILVRVPQLAQLDPVGMAKKYGMSPEDILGKTDFEIMVDQDILQQRKNGVLPTIKIGDVQFEVDLAANGLRKKGDRAIAIDLGKLQLNEDDELSAFFFNIKSGEVWQPPKGLLAIPGGIVGVKIPAEHILDPFGYAREHHLNNFSLLKRYPPKLEFMADLYDISLTELPKIVQWNRLNYGASDEQFSTSHSKKI